MKYTSAQAFKLLKKLHDEQRILIAEESASSVFLAAMGEDVEELRPVYDYEQTQARLADLDAKIRKVKHAINLFNCTTTVMGMTIDEVLVYLPQLNERCAKLRRMMQRREKQRTGSTYRSFGDSKSNILDYEYTNYDIKKTAADYTKVSDEIATLQTALDLANSTREIEIDL